MCKYNENLWDALCFPKNFFTFVARFSEICNTKTHNNYG